MGADAGQEVVDLPGQQKLLKWLAPKVADKEDQSFKVLKPLGDKAYDLDDDPDLLVPVPKDSPTLYKHRSWGWKI